MERLQHLISKLNEQNQQKESPLQMLVTLKHIEAELTVMHTAGGTTRFNPGVSVVMPSINIGNRKAGREPAEAPVPAARAVTEPLTTQPATITSRPQPILQTVQEPEVGELFIPVPVASTPAAADNAVPAPAAPAPVVSAPAAPAPVVSYRNGAAAALPSHTSPAAEALKKYQPQAAPVAEPERSREPALSNGEYVSPQVWSVDPLLEVPTLSHQPGAPELNDIIGLRNPSINDRLKDSGMTETGYQLKGAPVKELRKAIGVNDRYLFINELFRGDEVMYERSIKTINNFRILPEAQYWMERELKIKIGWDDSRDIVQHFYELVSRRFS